MDESSTAQNRRSRRSKLLMAATVETVSGTVGVTLRDLSAEGALVEGDGISEPGSLVVFRKKELSVSGRVAWVNERRAGIAFDAKLQPETVLRHVPAPRHRVDPVFKRPRLASHALTAEEKHWCQTLIWGPPLPSVES
jgi:hypothetical protein